MLDLDQAALRRVSEGMAKMIDLGLSDEPNEAKRSSLKMLPSYVCQLPDGSEKGDHLALDLGGTNFRVLCIKLEENRHAVQDSQIYVVPHELMVGSGEKVSGVFSQNGSRVSSRSALIVSVIRSYRELPVQLRPKSTVARKTVAAGVHFLVSVPARQSDRRPADHVDEGLQSERRRRRGRGSTAQGCHPKANGKSSAFRSLSCAATKF